jgi:hypothetical protein
MRRIPQLLVIALALSLTLLALASCQRRAVRAEVKALEENLTAPKVGEVQRATKQAISTAGRDIQLDTLTFLTDQPVDDYRDYVNDFLLARGYSQASLLSAPGEFRIEYDGMNGNIHVIVTAEVALPPESAMTTLPEEAKPEVPPAPPAEGAEGASSGSETAGAAEEPPPPIDESTPYRKITLEISY